MKEISNSSKWLGFIGLLAVVLGLTGCKSSEDRSFAQKWGDQQVAKGVKKELAKDRMYKYSDVEPVVFDGTVQLTGFVDTPEQRQRAAELAAQAKGVRQVINAITLKPTATGPVQLDTNAPAPPAPAPPEPPAPGAASPGQEPKSNP